MGVNIMDNFKTPYLARNIAEFWQRWHISLSTWFRDYLYFPLGGNRVSQTRWLYNIFVVFVISGIWHGANWTFVFWGGLYGIVYIIEHIINKFSKPKFSQKSFSFGHIILALKTFVLVTLIWVFFRSQNLNEAFHIFGLMFKNIDVNTAELVVSSMVWIMVLIFILSDLILYNKRFDSWINKLSFPLRWSIYSFFVFSIIVFSGVDDFPFIYFQF